MLQVHMYLNKYLVKQGVISDIFISVSRTTEELLLQWKKVKPVILGSDLEFPKFTIKEVTTDKCNESPSPLGNLAQNDFCLFSF